VPITASANEYPNGSRLPDHAEGAALRAWYAGMAPREAVARYLPERIGQGSAVAQIQRIRRLLVDAARARLRDDWVALLAHPPKERRTQARAVARTWALIERTVPPAPRVTDAVRHWLPARLARALERQDILTLSDLTVRVPRRRLWWRRLKGIGRGSAQWIERFFAAHPALTAQAFALIQATPMSLIVPWEALRPAEELDGSRGRFRAPAESCALSATNDYAAVNTWISLHESPATMRAYRKEAERLMLWALVERCKALSSLTTEDALAYRSFLRRPTPASRWIGPVRPRTSVEWRPFVSALSPESTAYALQVLNAMFRWLIEQRYLLVNPFSGIKVRAAQSGAPKRSSRAFDQQEWALIRRLADQAEKQLGWMEPAAQRLRFVLDFCYATGLRNHELVAARLGDLRWDEHGVIWLEVQGKGSKRARVVVPPLAITALRSYLANRGVSVIELRWNPRTALLTSLDGDGTQPLSGGRLWALVKRFFTQAAECFGETSPALSEKLRTASTHWMRHTHATHALAAGVELVAVRDNLRHANVSTTSGYLAADDRRRALQFGTLFGANPRTSN
jgi:site-specific recombinase XerD